MTRPGRAKDEAMTHKNQQFLSRRPRMAALIAAAVVAVGLTGAMPVAAQSPFSAAITINDSVVTNYEIDQRVRFLEVLNAPGDLTQLARDALVNERLQQGEARRLGLSAGAEQIEAGMTEFAARANLSAEELITALTEEGISVETFRDFIAVGITWRNVIQSRFAQTVRISEDDIDRAMLMGTSLEGARISLAEIVVPLTPENQDTLAEELGNLGRQLNGSFSDFSDAARRFSAAQTRESGGVVAARPLSAVPPQLLEVLIELQPGDVSGPIPLGPAVAIFQMRGLSDAGLQSPTVTEIDYATVAFAGGRTAETLAAAQALSASVDQCDDLYAERPGTHTRISLPPAQIPGDVALELARLDANEVSTGLIQPDGAALVWLMLCDRTVADPEGGRDAVRQRLFQQRLANLANGYLAELRAAAIIEGE